MAFCLLRIVVRPGRYADLFLLLGHGATGRGQAHEDLERVVAGYRQYIRRHQIGTAVGHTSSTADRSARFWSVSVLQIGDVGTHQGSDHDDTDRKPVPQAREADVLVYAAHRGAKGLARLTRGVQFTDHHVGRMRHDRAEDTGHITTGESDGGLGAFVVVRLLPRQVIVDHLHNGLEGSKLHHGVRNLSAPERVQALVQPVCPCSQRAASEVHVQIDLPRGSLFAGDPTNAIERARRKGWHGRLHANLDGFKRTERNVGEELGRGTRDQVYRRLPLGGFLRTDQVTVEGLEEFIPTVFESTLSL